MTITVCCPFCRHPYPMSPLQLEVYRGKSMGCMACGRSFPVVRPPEPPPPVEKTADSDAMLDARSDSSTAPELRSAYRDAATDVLSAGSGEATLFKTTTKRPSQPALPALIVWLTSPGHLGVACGVLFFVFGAAAAIVGYATSNGDPLFRAASAPRQLLQLACIAAVGAVGFGLIDVFRTRSLASPPQSAFTPAVRRTSDAGLTALVLGCSEILVCALLAFVFLPRLEGSLTLARRAACQNNLQQIGTMMIASASGRNDGRYPKSLPDFIDHQSSQRISKQCPADAVARGWQLSQASADEAAPSYIYLGNGLSMKGQGKSATAQTVLAYENAPRHEGGLYVLFADGAVLFVEGSPAQQIVQQLQAGQNPPQVALMVKP